MLLLVCFHIRTSETKVDYLAALVVGWGSFGGMVTVFVEVDEVCLM